MMSADNTNEVMFCGSRETVMSTHNTTNVIEKSTELVENTGINVEAKGRRSSSVQQDIGTVLLINYLVIVFV